MFSLEESLLAAEDDHEDFYGPGRTVRLGSFEDRELTARK